MFSMQTPTEFGRTESGFRERMHQFVGKSYFLRFTALYVINRQ